MNSMSGDISTLTSVILIPIINSYVPDEYTNDPNMKMIFSIAASFFLTTVLPTVKKWLTRNVMKLIQYLFQKTFQPSPNAFIIIDTSNPCYHKVILYFCKSQVNRIKGFLSYHEHGAYYYTIYSLKDDYLEETFQNYKIRIFFTNNMKKIGESETDDYDTSERNEKTKDTEDPIVDQKIVFVLVRNQIVSQQPDQAQANSYQILKDYVNHILMQSNAVQLEVTVYKIHLKVVSKKEKQARWQSKNIKICKTIENTIVSKEIRASFYDDVELFMSNEPNYIRKGLPFKRTYLLYGPPGTGKTSLVKAIANEYNLPIFLIDLNILENNAQLLEAIDSMHHLVSRNTKYLLVFEDMDQCKLFSSSTNQKKMITRDCFLNVLDGLDESAGRITMITCNDINKLKQMKALMRPGRIDRLVEVSYCTVEQMIDLIAFYIGIRIDSAAPEEAEFVKVLTELKISSAVLIHIMFLAKESIEKIKYIIKHIEINVWNSYIIRNDNEWLNKALLQILTKSEIAAVERAVEEAECDDLHKENGNELAVETAIKKEPNHSLSRFDQDMAKRMGRLKTILLDIKHLEEIAEYRGGPTELLTLKQQLSLKQKREQSVKLRELIKFKFMEERQRRENRKLYKKTRNLPQFYETELPLYNETAAIGVAAIASDKVPPPFHSPRTVTRTASASCCSPLDSYSSCNDNDDDNYIEE